MRHCGPLATWSAGLLAVGVLLIGGATRARERPIPSPEHTVLPAPARLAVTGGPPLPLTSDTVIQVPAGDPAAARVGQHLSALLGHALDPAPAVTDEVTTAAAIVLSIDEGAGTGEEGYTLTVSGEGVRISARQAAGLFYGVQTLRHLLPGSIEYRAARPREVTVPRVRIVDQPRYAWRGAMLDVARHFFAPADVKRYIDHLAMLKLNRLHLHLSDDQGWRLEIQTWPNLARHGGSTAVGGGPGGFYTQQDYRDLVAYASERFITVVPEIDLPSHINAALSSYPELNCDGTAPPLYTGIEVGFSTVCIDKEITYEFIDDVVREIAALTPGAWFHLGGDEVETLSDDEYVRFIERVQGIVESHGKTAVGWDEIATARLSPQTIVQHWRPDAGEELRTARHLILSPANRVYLDHKYDAETTLGLHWAGYVGIADAYRWDPAELLDAALASRVIGVEAPLWSETVETMDDVEFLAFPRLAGVAEIAWSPADARDWDAYRGRLAAQGPRWSALGINAYWAPEIDWVR